jgi:uridine kinase
MNTNRLWRDPIFKTGLLLKVLLIIFLVPELQQSGFVPFLVHAVTHPFSDPWSSFLATGGSSVAYPYGPVMLLAHIPGVLLGVLLDGMVNTNYMAGIGFRLGLLGADVAALYLLYRLLPEQPRKLLYFYWLSPITLFATYWNGQTDIIPIALLLLSLLLIKQFRPAASGVALALAFAAKLSMLLAVPFVAIYLWRNKRLISLRWPFAMGYGLTVLLVQGPWLFSSGFTSMVLGTPESNRVFDFALSFGHGLQLYLTPTLYLLALYGVWRLRRISFDLLIATIGLSFFLVVLGTPAPPGWYIWLVPFLVVHQIQSDRSAMILTAGFSLLLIGMHLVISSGASLPLLNLDPMPGIIGLRDLLTPRVHSLGITMIISVGLVLIVQMLRERVSRNDYYRIVQKPLSIGIAGDSGSGKDTFSQALAGIFGDHSVVHVSGDDYHVWDRYAPMWKGMTHLNPRANDLQRFTHDVLALISGKAISCRRYDHVAGRFSAPTYLDKNDVIIASGLHALHTQQLCKRFDISIFLDIDEKLRRHWKIRRDVHQRGHAYRAVQESIERRAIDAARFIHPQKNDANLVLSLRPVNASHLDEITTEHIRLKLVALIRGSTFHEKLARILIGICGLHIDVQPSEDSRDVEISIEGDVAAEDIALSANTLVPGMQEMLDIQPKWEHGMSGIMQLLVLVQIEESLKSRMK